jgi:HNH endonuclease
MPFSQSVANKALVACGRCCCICHKFCATRIELHHIMPEAQGGPNTFENCIPLCFDCHEEVGSYNPSHPKGRKFTEKELKIHRDHWYAKVCAGSTTASPNEDHLRLDRELFSKVRKLLPSNGSIEFVRGNNYAGISFATDAHRDLEEFDYFCARPENEFFDIELETAKGGLLTSIRKFLRLIALNTWYNSSTKRSSVPPEWEEEQPDRFWKITDEIHELADDICKRYDEFIRLGRRKLAI